MSRIVFFLIQQYLNKVSVLASGGVRRYLWSREVTVLEVDRVGLTQVKGLLLQDLITLPTESEEVAVNNNVCLFAGRDGRMVASCPSYPPSSNLSASSSTKYFTLLSENVELFSI